MRLSVMPEVFHLPEGFRGRGIFARLSTLDEATLRDLLIAPVAEHRTQGSRQGVR